MTDQLRISAVRFAKQRLLDDADWQEVQFDLLNDDRFQTLFPSAEDGGMVSDEDGEAAMSIIRDAEDEIAEDSIPDDDDEERFGLEPVFGNTDY